MTTDELRAEADAIQAENGGEPSTRSCMVRAAADEIDRLWSGIIMADRLLGLSEINEKDHDTYLKWCAQMPCRHVIQMPVRPF